MLRVLAGNLTDKPGNGIARQQPLQQARAQVATLALPLGALPAPAPLPAPRPVAKPPSRGSLRAAASAAPQPEALPEDVRLWCEGLLDAEEDGWAALPMQ